MTACTTWLVAFLPSIQSMDVTCGKTISTTPRIISMVEINLCDLLPQVPMECCKCRPLMHCWLQVGTSCPSENPAWPGWVCDCANW